MKVAKLIEILQTLDREADVLIEAESDCYNTLCAAIEGSVVKNKAYGARHRKTKRGEVGRKVVLLLHDDD